MRGNIDRFNKEINENIRALRVPVLSPKSLAEYLSGMRYARGRVVRSDGSVVTVYRLDTTNSDYNDVSVQVSSGGEVDVYVNGAFHRAFTDIDGVSDYIVKHLFFKGEDEAEEAEEYSVEEQSKQEFEEEVTRITENFYKEVGKILKSKGYNKYKRSVQSALVQREYVNELKMQFVNLAGWDKGTYRSRMTIMFGYSVVDESTHRSIENIEFRGHEDGMFDVNEYKSYLRRVTNSIRAL